MRQLRTKASQHSTFMSDPLRAGSVAPFTQAHRSPLDPVSCMSCVPVSCLCPASCDMSVLAARLVLSQPNTPRIHVPHRPSHRTGEHKRRRATGDGWRGGGLHCPPEGNACVCIARQLAGHGEQHARETDVLMIHGLSALGRPAYLLPLGPAGLLGWSPRS